MQLFQGRNHLFGTSSLKGWDVTQQFELGGDHRVHATSNLLWSVCFLDLVGHYRRFIKGFACIAQPLSEHLAGEGASRKSEWVSLSEDALKAFEALKQACMTAPILAFADYTKQFPLETDASKDRLGADRWYHPVTYGSTALMPHKKNYHLTKLEFLALKWAVTEHFKEYPSYQSFLVRMDNNPLTYIMMTPNLDTTSHWWVNTLAEFNFELEYQKGHDNTARHTKPSYYSTGPGYREINPWCSHTGNHALSWSSWPHCSWGWLPLGAWAKAQKEDLMLSTVLDWLKAQKRTDLKALLAENTSSKEGHQILWNWQNFTIHQGALYLCSMPKGETDDLLLFLVPKAHCVATLNGCHKDAGHQGHDHTLSLLQECFWWTGMANQMQQAIKSCMHCLQHDSNLSKAPLHPIVVITLMDLLHVDFTSIETTLEMSRPPKVTNILVFQDHFTKHVMTYVTPNLTAKTVTKFLCQGYIMIFGAPARLLSDWRC